MVRSAQYAVRHYAVSPTVKFPRPPQLQYNPKQRAVKRPVPVFSLNMRDRAHIYTTVQVTL